MSIALDLGSCRLKSLRYEGNLLVGRSCRSRYAVIENAESQRMLLNHMHIPHAIFGESLVVMGDHAADFSRLFLTPCLSLLPQGKVSQNSPAARQITASLLEALLPEPKQADELCCFTFPNVPDEAHQQGNPEIEFFLRLIRLQGYKPLVLKSSLAVVPAELVGCSFTGIGINMGASGCDVSVTQLGNEVASCSFPQGGDWIDEQFASRSDSYTLDAKGNRFPDLLGVSSWKESLTGSIVEGATQREKLLCDITRELVSKVLHQIAGMIERTPAIGEIPRELGMAVCGGTARIPGFDRLFREELQNSPLPIDLSNLSVGKDSEFTVARGCLIHAELESQWQSASRAA
jgi:hypothetical protein